MNIVDKNWMLIGPIFSPHVTYEGGKLINRNLAPTLFAALCHAIERKLFAQHLRLRKDDSLRRAIGNWLQSDEFGAWRNPNKAKPYKGNNKQVWKDFKATSLDLSMKKVLSSDNPK